MLNFAEQTGSGVCVLTVTGFALQHFLDFTTVIVVWSFLIAIGRCNSKSNYLLVRTCFTDMELGTLGTRQTCMK
jgi:hypothetical protein